MLDSVCRLAELFFVFFIIFIGRILDLKVKGSYYNLFQTPAH